jgi:ABC-type transport system involved in multi-copper enzyme maturation permease subunit
MFTVIRLEIKKNINCWTAAGLLIFLIIFSGINQVGIEKFKVDEKQQEDFIHVQEKLIEGFINYEQYGIFGIDRLLLGCPLISLFYNSSTLTELQANIEYSTRYKLYKPEMGKNLFIRPTGGSLVISLWSFFACRNREYMMLFNNFASPGRIYVGVVLARVILIIISIFIVVLAVRVQFIINGIPLTGSEISALFYFFLVSFITMSVLAAISTRLGAVKNWKKGAVITAISWIIVVFLWPEVLNLIFSRKAEVQMKSLEEYQIQKNEKLQVFEKEALKDTGRYKTIPERNEFERKRIEHYWNVVSIDIKKLDLQMIDKTEEISRQFQAASIFNPVTFYKSVNNELGSKGFNSYNRFFRENLEIQRGFLRKVFDKRYYENYTKVGPYLPFEKLVVKAEPGLPAFFTAGILLNLFYLLIAIFWGSTGFKRLMFPKPEATGGYKEVKLDCQQGNIEVVTSDNQDLYAQVVNVLFGIPRDFNGKITVDGQSVVNSQIKPVVYVPGQDKIPGNFRVNDLFNLAAKLPGTTKQQLQQIKMHHHNILKKRFAHLDPGQRTVILLDLCGLKEAKIYLIRDFKPVMYGKSLIPALNKLRSIKESGALILCLSEIFMRPSKSYNYSYDSKEKKYIDLENDLESI